MAILNSSMLTTIMLLLTPFLYNEVIVNASCQGCVDLDVLTFDKLISKFPYSLIKFDIAFPYGEKHEAFGKFAKNYVIRLNNELIVGLVGIKDYGDKDNSELREKYSVDKEKYPAIFLFKNTTVHAKWPEGLDISYKSIKEFVKSNTDLYIGLDGCLKEFDDMVVTFMASSDSIQKNAVLEQVKSRSEKVKGTSPIYVLTMEKILKSGNKFITDEIVRIGRILKTKISANKKTELGHKLNIMKMFEKLIPKKEEL